MKLYSLLFLLGLISSAKLASIIITLETTQQLCKICMSLANAEIAINLAGTLSTTATSEVKQQILEIQGLLEENQRKCQELIENYHDGPSNFESQCRKLNPNGPAFNSFNSTHAYETLRNEISRLPLELTGIREKLRYIEENNIFKNFQKYETVNTSSQATSIISTIPISNTSFTFEGGRLTQEEFEKIIQTKPRPSQGKSYNGSSLEEISTRASHHGFYGRSLTVQFVNYLNRSLTNCDLYDPNNSVYLHDSNFIPPSTTEVFAFSEPVESYQNLAMSYSIPCTSVKIAWMLELESWVYFAMAFVEENTSSEDYFSSGWGIPGSSEYFHSSADKGSLLVVSYRNHQVRANLTIRESNKIFLRIEVIQVTSKLRERRFSTPQQ